ncbi:flippase [Ruminococcus flavefaciens]|uniref:flippase n=1 Tax=Ruminococcus flavefaciens TaxID=1265 RepID=UPI0004644CD5|nr:flippase [Ruminococcus flavefaciens]
MENVSNIKKNTIFNTLKTVFGIIYPLITFPYISRVLLTDNVGKINFGNSIVSYVTLVASLGVNTYAIRECSKVKYDKNELSKISSQILSINIISSLVAYVALAIVLIFARPLENYRLLIIIQSTSVLFTTLGADWLNTAMEDFKFIAVRTICMQIAALLLMFIFIHKPEDYMIYAVISVVASSGANVVNIFYRKKYCKTGFTLKMNAKKHLPRILLLFSLILSQTIYVNSDITILGLIKGDHEVGLYSTSVKMYTIINTTIASIAWVVMPKLSLHFQQKNYSEINRLLKYALNYILVLGIPCVCGLEVIAPHLIILIAGEAYVDATISLRILGVAMMCSFIAGWIGNMTRIPAGRENVSLRISVISACINIILNLILIPKFGLNAAALTTAVSECFGMICGLILIDRKIKIDELSNMLIGPISGGVGIVLIGIASQLLFSKTWIITIVTVFVSVIWYFAVMLITKNEFFASFIKPIIFKIIRRE